MYAAVFYGPNDIQIKEIDIKKKRLGNEYLLKVLSCSVCSYDIRTFRNGHFKVTPPMILGHEICAEIIDGYQGKNFSIKPKTRVAVYPILPCFDCWYCNNKNYNLCTNLKEIGSTINGGFAEYLLIPERIFDIGGLVPVLDNISNEEAALIEPLACCLNSINQVKNLEFDSVIILGDGPIGVMQLMLLKRFFKIDVTLIGKVQHRLDLAKKLGADMTILIDDELNVEKYKKLIKNGKGEYSPNIIFVSNNNPNSLNLALNLANKNGKIVLFSGVKNENTKKEKQFNIDPNFIHYNQVSIFGSFSSTPNNMIEAMNLVNSKEINLKSLVTHTFSLTKVNEAFVVSETFKGFKSIINRFS
jgi:L-iditol 2-dehydrogenase